MKQLDFEDYILKFGGHTSSMTELDVKEFNASEKRILNLMSDGMWHSATEIELIAGKNGVPARQGLRRLRGLRRHGFNVEVFRGNSREFLYRIK